jgi:hypothetical protein
MKTAQFQSGKESFFASWIYRVSLICFTLVTACGDLEFSNPNGPDEGSVSIQSLVTGTESGMRIDLDIYLRVVSVIGRETYYFEPADPRYTGELLYGTIDPGGFLLNRPWNARYRVVKNCNILLERAESLPTEEAAGVRGFAGTILAYQLMLNLNYEDDNGIKIDFSGGDTVHFATKSASLAFIGALLDDAFADLGGAGSEFSFVLSDGFNGFDTPATFGNFNRALRARVAIYEQDWNTALTALGGSFLNTSGSMGTGVYHTHSTGPNDILNPIYEDPASAFVKYMVHPSLGANAEAGDTRYTSKVFVRTDTTTFDDLKSNVAVNLSKSATDYFPIVRNEELILLRAEANIGLGNYGLAEADINVVRAAAGLAPVTLNAGNALDQLLHEKQYSLFGEGHRWVDMRRYGRLNQLPIDRTGDAIVDDMPRPENEPDPG